MSRGVAVLATLDTKGQEAGFVAQQIAALGARAEVFDIGVVGAPTTAADVTREQVAVAGGTPLDELLRAPTREAAAPVMVAGATALLQEQVARGAVHAVLGLGGLQGTAACTEVMRALPFGFPKIMVSTVASGDTSAYVGIKDVTMMFSVGDILGLNRFTKTIFANAAGAAVGMAQVGQGSTEGERQRPLVGVTNLGVLTEGTMRALQHLDAAGIDGLVFHAVGSGGRAMEQMMKEGLLDGVFDYALGEIADDVFGALRAGGPERLTVAGDLGLPQVLCPGGAEHLGVLVDPPKTVPDRWRDHAYCFHNPVVFVPRLNGEEMVQVADEIAKRLAAGTRGDAVMMLPRGGTSRYSIEGGPLRDPTSDAAFFAALTARLPATVEVVDRETQAEDDAFVAEAVQRLAAMLSRRGGSS
ncbi:MAG: Tm-1-like ATP-binding domain-containing protein [Planctomycetota bacterium]